MRRNATALKHPSLSQVAGVIFPVPIMLLVPIRQFIMPRVFPRAALAVLDPMPGDKAGIAAADETVADDTNASLAAPAEDLT